MDEASFSSLPLTGRLLSSTATWEVSFEWFARKACDHQCLLDHPLPLFWLLPHRHGRPGRLRLTAVFSLWVSFISSQLPNVYWLFWVYIHCCTWLSKNLYNPPLIEFLLFFQLTWEELSYVTCRRSGQASAIDHSWIMRFIGCDSCLGGLSSLSPVSKEWIR
jgi:hypothetical protein